MSWTDNNGQPVNPYEPHNVRHVHYFIVRGCGEFPIDMLRYDKAWAVTGIGEPDAFDEPIRDVVCATGDRATSIPTDGRWESFGWQVIERRVPHQDIHELLMAQGTPH